MAWQAVNRMHYSQAGGGGPEGVARRAGSAAAGFDVLTLLGLRRGAPRARRARPAQLAAVRHALTVWQVNTVVIATNPAAPPLQQGQRPDLRRRLHDGRPGPPPTIEAGAWVWNHVQLGRSRALARHGRARSRRACGEAEGGRGRVVAGPAVSDCVVPLGRSGLRDQRRCDPQARPGNGRF